MFSYILNFIVSLCIFFFSCYFGYNFVWMFFVIATIIACIYLIIYKCVSSKKIDFKYVDIPRYCVHGSALILSLVLVYYGFVIWSILYFIARCISFEIVVSCAKEKV